MDSNRENVVTFCICIFICAVMLFLVWVSFDSGFKKGEIHAYKIHPPPFFATLRKKGETTTENNRVSFDNGKTWYKIEKIKDGLH